MGKIQIYNGHREVYLVYGNFFIFMYLSDFGFQSG